jgi:hypothetical protein
MYPIPDVKVAHAWGLDARNKPAYLETRVASAHPQLQNSYISNHVHVTTRYSWHDKASLCASNIVNSPDITGLHAIVAVPERHVREYTLL